jgi:hypothetical protein
VNGFVRFKVGGARVVCAPHVADGIREALRAGSLYRYAASNPDARALAGRGIVYAVRLPGTDERVVIRRNRHGGLFAPLTGDLFRPPTRAPHELMTSERLRAAGVPTPVMLGYVVCPAIPGLVRVDVFSREIPDSFDLSEILTAPKPIEVAQAWRATQRLVHALVDAGARHHDLNVKNILLRRAGADHLDAFALDVDRVEFSTDRDAVNEENVTRLMRSANKWREVWGAPISPNELRDLETLLRAPHASASTSS